MKLTAQVKLVTTPQQHTALLQTLERANAACNWLSEQAWQQRTFWQYALHRLCYHTTRNRFDLNAQVIVRCIAKVADAYKLDTRTRRVFSPHSAIAYDARNLSWDMPKSTVSLWTVAGRMKGLPFVCGERQRELLRGQRGESDLILFNGSFYLFATCDVEEPEPNDVLDVLGVDLGIATIAVDSDGQVRSGSQIKSVRYRHRRLRQKLQVKGTKSSRRRLKRLSGKEARFAKDTNHCISKQLVQTAKDTGRALAIENLNGIRDRGTVRRSQRVHLHSWSFYQLRQFLTYKARKAGVVLVAVDPRNSSRTCPACGYIDKRNRSAQATFSCLSCGFAGLADYIAAVNLRERGRAAVNLPNVSDAALSVCHAVVPGTRCLL